MDSKRKAPRRKGDDRVILHFDLDCFYAQCIENANPSLKTLPLGIKQKSILATCNYVARKHGVKKLMGIQEAKRLCPDLVLADGEDLSPFRDVSKRIYSLLKSYSWNGRVERLGLDEVFLDVTDIVAYNLALLNHHNLEHSWFCLSREDPEKGFEFDAREVKGCVWPPEPEPRPQDEGDDNQRLRLLLGSHLGFHLRQQIESLGYTSACGISTNKLLAKLAGDKNKPRNQTTLLSSAHPAPFLDPLPLSKIPGIGSKTKQALKTLLKTDEDLTVHNARTHPAVSPFALERALDGGEKGIGQKVWLLLHGIDSSEVKPARDIPRQISIEDTYRGLTDLSQIRAGLVQITTSLLKRMHVDLLDDSEQPVTPPFPSSSPFPSSKPRWLGQPKTIRLTTRPYYPPSERDDFEYNHGRASKSAPLPRYIFDLATNTGMIVERLVEGTLLPLFHSLNPDSNNLRIGLLNVCVINMDGEKHAAGGSDIMAAFQRQKEVGEIRAVAFAEERPNHLDDVAFASQQLDMEPAKDSDSDEEAEWVDDDDHQDGVRCHLCGCVIPVFAVEAHGRWHELDEGYRVEPRWW
ncbi:putative DNA polymerase iota [Triangularia verruculosa]|uniref:DNA polymerase iota n=1 Tax=Triangularia verruculosa TaxID=2587418 RepID=A0AAN6XEM7_9PEZI|nr:putative DNA polymerase iota [Triangularia verruculosa]